MWPTATSRPLARRFVLADTPGHEEYTRNMVTGASRADVSLILVDATRGAGLAVAPASRAERVLRRATRARLREQDGCGRLRQRRASRRSRASSPLSPHGSDCRTCGQSRSRPEGRQRRRALGPDALVRRARRARGARAPAGLSGGRGRGVRLPVQWTIDQREGPPAAACQIARKLRRARRSWILPAGECTTVETIEVMGEPLEEASAPRSVTVRLADEVPVGRGSLLAPVDDAPRWQTRSRPRPRWLSEDSARQRRQLARAQRHR